jgi:glycosyltransferase involved in cell wall biosynthesis
MRIGIVTEFFPKSAEVEVRGGAEARAFHLAREIAKKEEVVVLTTRERGYPRESEFLGIKVIQLGLERMYSQTGSLAGRMSFLLEGAWFKKELDVVDGHCFVAYPIAWRIANRVGIPAVATYHDVWVGRWIRNIGIIGVAGELLERYVLTRRWDRVIAVSGFTARRLAECGVEPERVVVIPNGVDVERIAKIETEREPEPTICCISRLVRYKHVDQILRAIVRLKREMPSVRCKIVGTGPDECALRELTARLGLEKNVEFLGFVRSHSEVMRILKSSHVFCLASTVEGFGIVLLEAMAAEVPFVATAIEPLLEASGGRGGLFFTPGNIEEMGEKLRRLLTDENLRREKIREGKEWVKNYRWEEIGRRVLEVYRELAEE